MKMISESSPAQADFKSRVHFRRYAPFHLYVKKLPFKTYVEAHYRRAVPRTASHSLFNFYNAIRGLKAIRSFFVECQFKNIIYRK